MPTVETHTIYNVLTNWWGDEPDLAVFPTREAAVTHAASEARAILEDGLGGDESLTPGEIDTIRTDLEIDLQYDDPNGRFQLRVIPLDVELPTPVAVRTDKCSIPYDDYIEPGHAKYVRIFDGMDGLEIDAACEHGRYTEVTWTHWHDKPIKEETVEAAVAAFAEEVVPHLVGTRPHRL